MMKSYLKIAWRNLLRHKAFSLINILGLSIGIATCTIIFLYVRHELAFDQYNKNASRIVRVTANLRSPENDLRLATAPALLAPNLKRNLPEIAEAVRIQETAVTVKWQDRLYRENDFCKSDQSIFSVFDFVFIEGSPVNALKAPNSIVVARSVARKYFGKLPALGKTLICDKEPLLITGVIEDRPSNSDLNIPALISGDFDKNTKWLDELGCFSFVLFKTEPDLQRFSKKLASISSTYVQPELNAGGATSYKMEFESELLKDVHFSKGKLGDTAKGNKQYSLIFSLLAGFILLIALLNYINLTTARSFERAREVGVRKVIGARPIQVITQFLFESFLLIIIAWIFGNIFVMLGLPLVNSLLETRLAVQWGHIIIFTTCVLLISFLLAGIYPAVVMSAYKPVTVLKGRWQRSFKGIWLRKVVTVTQFAIAAALIMGTTVIYYQMQNLRNRDLGYNKDQLMAVYLPSDSTLGGSLRAFQNDLRKRPEIIRLTSGARLEIEGLGSSTTVAETNGRKKEFMCNFFEVDPDYIPLFQMKLVEGRNFSDSFSTDKTEAFIVNEAFVRSMGWTSALDKELEGPHKKGRIIGVVHDYSYKSLHNIIEPLVLVYNTGPWMNTTTIRIRPKDLPVVEALYKKHFPSLYFDYAFLDDILNQYYRQDKITMSLFNQFTILAIFISGLGLYGLVALVTAYRTKEIGVRKVFGASLSQLFSLLSKDFLILILVALIIALPLMAIAMHNWLSAYPYRISLDWTIFLVPVAATVLIALAVITKEIIRVSLINPVISLRTD
ncbi:MAG TPA: ABC transporter permease [Niastella sp.]